MKNNPDLFDLADVCAYFNLSESSIRRRIRATRNGTSNFPLPLWGAKNSLRWHRSTIENYQGEDSETITITPSPVPSFPKVTQVPNADQTRRTLEAFGISLPPTNTKPPPIS